MNEWPSSLSLTNYVPVCYRPVMYQYVIHWQMMYQFVTDEWATDLSLTNDLWNCHGGMISKFVTDQCVKWLNNWMMNEQIYWLSNTLSSSSSFLPSTPLWGVHSKGSAVIWLIDWLFAGAMIAHKFKITNPQDYGLVLLCDGEGQCPLSKPPSAFFSVSFLWQSWVPVVGSLLVALVFSVLCWYGLYVLSLNVPFVCDVLTILSWCSLGVFVLNVNCVCYGFCLFVLNVICW